MADSARAWLKTNTYAQGTAAGEAVTRGTWREGGVDFYRSGSNLAESSLDLLLPPSQRIGERGGHRSPRTSAVSLLCLLDSGAAPTQRKSILHSIFLMLIFYIFILLLFKFPFHYFFGFLQCDWVTRSLPNHPLRFLYRALHHEGGWLPWYQSALLF